MRAPILSLLVVSALGTLLSCNPPAPPVESEPDDLGGIEGPPDLAAGPDLTTPRGDSLPKGAVAYFQRKDCPRGWEKLALAAGRTLVPTVGADPVETAAFDPLGDSEDRSHGHGVMATITLPSVGYAGIAGEANHGLGRSGSSPLTGSTSKVPAGLPYVQLLVCHKTDDPDVRQRPVAKGTLVFFRTTECPRGFVQAGASQGRFVIGVPELATPGQKFGGPPLQSGEKRGHRHALAGAITTTSHGIALAGGGTSGYAKNDRHPYQVDSSNDSSGFPYLQLLHCQKE